MLEIFTGQPILPGCLYKRIEKRMGRKRLRLIFGMKLAGDKIWMSFSRKLDHLNEFSIRRDTAEYQSFPFQRLAKLRIEFVSMTVTLADLFGSIISISR